MLRKRRWVLPVVAAVALIGCGGDGADPVADGPRATASPAEHTPGPATSDGDAGSTSQGPSPEDGSADAPADDGTAHDDVDVRAAVEIRDGRVQGGVESISADVGDTVELTVTSDVADEVHVHGYDLHAPVGPDQPAVVTFQSDIPGVFEIELEQRGLRIAEATVGA